RKPVLVRDIISSYPSGRLVEELSGESISTTRYNRFDNTTDENIVIPLFASSRTEAPCGMINLERNRPSSSARPWTEAHVRLIEERLDGFGQIIARAVTDELGRRRTRRLIDDAPYILANLFDNKDSAETTTPAPSAVDVLLLCAINDELTETRHAL